MNYRVFVVMVLLFIIMMISTVSGESETPVYKTPFGLFDWLFPDPVVTVEKEEPVHRAIDLVNPSTKERLDVTLVFDKDRHLVSKKVELVAEKLSDVITDETRVVQEIDVTDNGIRYISIPGVR